MTEFNTMDDAFDDFERQATDQLYEQLAQGLADQARDLGLTSANSIELESVSDESDFQVDPERVRRRANEILLGS